MTTAPTIRALYQIPATTADSFAHTVDVSGAIRLGSITGLVDEAELGAVGQGNIVLDDPTSTLGYLGDGIVGLKRFLIDEVACPAGTIRLFTGWIGDRRYHRGQGDSLITGAARKIDVTLVDENALLSFRVFAPVALEPTWSFVRPAETDIARITALLSVAFIATSLFDVGYVNTVGPVAMDANDYTGSHAGDVLNDCAQQSGKNYFVMWNPNESAPKNVLWYDRYNSDGSATIAFDSTLRLTNVLSEVDNSVTFADDMNAVETVDPSRVVAGVYLPYTGGTTYRKQITTENAFAYRDEVAPSVTVKTLTKANARADRYLLQNSTEAARISCTVQLPRTHATLIKAGQRLQVHFTHLPNVAAGFTWTRVLQRTVRQDQETQFYYWLDLELAPITGCPAATPAGYYAPLGGVGPKGGGYANDTPANGVTQYGAAGQPLASQPPGNAAGFTSNIWNFPNYSIADVDSPAGFSDRVGANLTNTVILYLTGDGLLEILTYSITGTCTMNIYQQDAEPGAAPPGSQWVSLSTVLATGITASSYVLNIAALNPTGGFPCSHLVTIQFNAVSLPAARYYRGINWTPA